MVDNITGPTSVKPPEGGEGPKGQPSGEVPGGGFKTLDEVKNFLGDELYEQLIGGPMKQYFVQFAQHVESHRQQAQKEADRAGKG